MNIWVEIIFTGQDVFRVHKSPAVLPSLFVHRPKGDMSLQLSVGQRGDFARISSEQVETAAKFAAAAVEMAGALKDLYQEQQDEVAANANADLPPVVKHARF